MTLPEIYVALPHHVAELLEKLLEASVLPDNPTAEETEVAAKLLIKFMKDELTAEEPKTYELLDQIPAAVVAQIYE